MSSVDHIVLMLYLAGIVAVGALFTRRNRSTAEMFAAGGQSPWWASGLSGFMTMFSAGTFVVWGGIAYKFAIRRATRLSSIRFCSKRSLRNPTSRYF